MAYHYDPEQALEELQEDAVLPNPVFVRDMIFRARLPVEATRTVDADLQAYLADFGETQKVARRILERLAGARATR
ncbi:MAG: hypothetical protein IH793_00115 [Acidobacteria bacterium]|nr:hypothetical protein [Acidobacteriota bacterium]